MRRWLILLMVVLLLRGWAGDLMGIRMAATGAASAAAMAPDCPLHPVPAAGPADPSAAMPDMENCSACELCVAIAKPGGGSLGPTLAVSHERPALRRTAFVSACLALPVVPPIL